MKNNGMFLLVIVVLGCVQGESVDVVPNNVADIIPPQNCSHLIASDGGPDLTATRYCILEATKSIQYCRGLSGDSGVFTQRVCLTTLAALINSTKPCESLSGDDGLLCVAAAKHSLAECDKIQANETKDECVRTLGKNANIKSREDCEGQTGEDLAWCLIYNAEDEIECLKIDPTSYTDESIFCVANSRGEVGICEKIGDDIVRSMCVREVTTRRI
ncbi:MAG: hypothetical protein KKD39_03405 [Candidatus Altiarchaeota archaeon]|nr:hypothetical protein [Candidatus Altiarchaeota archaeon]